MIKINPLVSRFVLIILLPLVFCIVYAYNFLHASLPTYDGQMVISGIDNSVDLTRDNYGIVRIEASTDNDAFFAIGFAHAQDRLWQLELQKRAVQGRLSEVFGEQSLNKDIWMRTLGLHQSAKKDWFSLSTEAQNSLHAYAAGINAFLSSGRSLPVEFTLMNIQPQPWEVYDSLAITKLFSLMLSDNMNKEMSRFLAYSALPDKNLSVLFKNYPHDAPVTSSEQSIEISSLYSSENSAGFTSLLELTHSFEQDLKIGGKYVGSNVWVLSGSHTKSGNAILANDPHLKIQMPSFWYAAGIKGHTIDVTGMTLVGVPVVIFGKNNHIAWGGANMMADNQDLYLERVNPNNSTEYLHNGQWQQFTVRHETIDVKADFPSSFRPQLKPVEVTIRNTLNGPVISDLYRVFEQPVSLRWTALAGEDTSYQAYYELNYASNWQDFKTALHKVVSPNLNLLFADVQGNIGFLGVGSIPLRGANAGVLPSAGWIAENLWQGMVPVDQWPQSFNPEQGYIVNANNKTVDESYPYYISNEWADPARAIRIQQLLDEKITDKRSLDFQDMADIQGDVLSLVAQKLVPVMTSVHPRTELQKEALAYFKTWQGDMAQDSVAATLFVVWTEFLKDAIYRDELKTQYGENQRARIFDGITQSVPMNNLLNSLSETDSVWCDNVSTEARESCESVLLSSLDSAIARLKKLRGSNMDNWKWGDINQATYSHVPMSSQKLLDLVFERKVKNGGSVNTVNAIGAYFKESEGYEQGFGAGFRQIMSPGTNSDEHWLMNSTGQSGNVLSAHYDDMLYPFRDLEFIDISRPVGQLKKLTLTPATDIN